MDNTEAFRGSLPMAVASIALLAVLTDGVTADRLL
jgi:hypothetical protein